MLSRSRVLFSRSVRYYGTKTKRQSVLKGNPLLVVPENQSVSRESFFAKKRVVLFGVPGAFTPVCTNKHVSILSLI